MSATTADKIQTLNVCFGSYAHTKALKDGGIASDRVAMSFTEINPVNRAFMLMAREQKFDVSEMAIVTYLQAKAYGKPHHADAGDDVRALSARHHAVQFRSRHAAAARSARPPGRRARVRADHRRLVARHSVEGLRP